MPRTLSRTACLFAILFSGIVATPCLAQVSNENSILVTNDVGESNRNGWPIAIQNGTIVYSIASHWNNEFDTSAVYTFDLASQTQSLKLIPIDFPENSFYGRSVAIDQGTIAVGAPNESPSGTVYLFDANSGQQLARITPPDTNAEIFFGASLAIDGGMLAIGATSARLDGSRIGAVYIFDIKSQSLITKLQPSEPVYQLRFGASIAIENGVIAIGAPNDNEHGSASGSVYLFDIATENQLMKLLPDGTDAFAFFGNTLHMRDGILAIGAPIESNIGSAYLFDATTGEQLHKLRPAAAGLVDHFGSSIYIDDGRVAIGAVNYTDTVSSDLDYAYIYDISSGELLNTLAPNGHGLEDVFSNSITMENGIVLASATDVNDAQDRSASIYLFDLNTPPCFVDFNNDGNLDNLDITNFLASYTSQEAAADFTNDGNYNFFDISAFTQAFATGCP